MKALTICFSLLALLAACQTSTPRQSATSSGIVETREFDTGMDIALQAVVGALQDSGYTIEVQSAQTGVVRARNAARGLTAQVLLGPSPGGSAGEARTRIRLQLEPGLDPRAGQELFARIEHGILARSGIY